MLANMPTPDDSALLSAELLGAGSVLCVQPHYDDNDIGAGGTLGALSSAGVEIHYLTVADDLMGVLDPKLPNEDATATLRREQAEAGRHIGVGTEEWLALPDAGNWDVVGLRTRIIEAIRRHAPDYVVTCDPWLPNEAHRDHTRTGIAAAEALLFYGMPRFVTTPEVDDAYMPHRVQGLLLYFTLEPNLVFQIDATQERKHRALDAYRAQFTEEGLVGLHQALRAMESRWAEGHSFACGEALRLLRPHELHVGLAAYRG